MTRDGAIDSLDEQRREWETLIETAGPRDKHAYEGFAIDLRTIIAALRSVPESAWDQREWWEQE